MTHNRDMTPAEVQASAELGNRIGVDLMRKSKPSCDATIRHAIHTDGLHAAKLLAVKLLGLSYQDAGQLCRRLQATRAVDIVAPHWKL